MSILKARIKIVLDSMTKKSYHRWYQKTGLASTLEYRGVRILKFVPDLWNYQEIIFDYKITNVIEFGSKFGGSAIYFADVLKTLNTGGKVLCVDIRDVFVPESDRPDIQKLIASSTSDICRETMIKFRNENKGNILIILDSLHENNHVYNELKLIHPLLVKGDYLVIEDADFGNDMLGSMKKFFDEHILEYDHDKQREEKFGVTFAKYGYWIRK